jgi:ABC-type transport system involved in Fe-S cluster assembly fused permease/ATPase subunit
VTASIALGVLFWLNWKLTAVTILFLVVFGGGMAWAFVKLRPVFRERSKINAAVTGRLTESIGGIRIVKSYVAERREDLIFARGVHRLFRNIAISITGVSALGALTTVVVGAIGATMIVMGGRAIMAGEMTIGDLLMYVLFRSRRRSPASIGFARSSEPRPRTRRTSGTPKCPPWSVTSGSTGSGSNTIRVSRCSGTSVSMRPLARPPRWWVPAARARAPS